MGAVGLTTVGFILPVFLYVSAKKQHSAAFGYKLDIPFSTNAMLLVVLTLGLFNVFVTGGIAFLVLLGIKL